MVAGDGEEELQFTAWFASPDVLNARAFCHGPKRAVKLVKNDMWAVGCILVWMLTGVFPFFCTNEEMMDILCQHQ